jgi:hypothetical protein
MQNNLLVAILKTPFTVLRKVFSFLFSSQGRIVLVAIIALVVFLVIRGQFSKNNTPQQFKIPAYQLTLPTKQLAPRIIQTSTRYYAYATFTEDNQYFTLTDYYVYNTKDWQHFTSPLPINKKDIVSNILR